MPSLSSTSTTGPLPFLWGTDTIDELVARRLTEGKRAVELSSTTKVLPIRRYEVDNSTAPKVDSDFIYREATLVLEAARDSGLGDDHETEFYDRLQEFVARYQRQGVDTLTALIVSQQNNLFAISKTLEAIGAIDDATTATERFWTLQRGLCSPSKIIRYGAALGFGSLRDSRAIPVLEQVAEREPNSEIKTVLLQVITLLKTSR